MANDIVSNVWDCERCKNSFNITGMQRLRHLMGKQKTIKVFTFYSNINEEIPFFH